MSKSKSIIDQLNQFMQGPCPSNAWLKSRGIIAYVRHNNRYIRSMFIPTFTLASVSTTKSITLETKTGRLRPVMTWMDSLLESKRVKAIVVESVVSERMTEILEKHYWHKLDDTEAPSWIKFRNSI